MYKETLEEVCTKRPWKKYVQRDLGRSMYKETLEEVCTKRPWKKYVQRDLGRSMYKETLEEVCTKRPWKKYVEDWTGASVWRVGRTAEDRDTYRRYISAEMDISELTHHFRNITCLHSSISEFIDWSSQWVNRVLIQKMFRQR